MHEMGIAIRIMDIVRESLPSNQPVRVRSVRLRVGTLSAVVPASLRACFAQVSDKTPLEGAELLIHNVAVRVACARCDELSAVERLPFVCAGCGSDDVQIVNGRELMVESIEVD